MLRPIAMLGLAALAATAAGGAGAAPFAGRAMPQYLTAGPSRPPANLNCPGCGRMAQGPGQYRPGGAVMLNPQPLPPRWLAPLRR